MAAVPTTIAVVVRFLGVPATFRSQFGFGLLARFPSRHVRRSAFATDVTDCVFRFFETTLASQTLAVIDTGRLVDIFDDGLLKRNGNEIVIHSYSFDRCLIEHGCGGK
jgi:hypothetical protein